MSFEFSRQGLLYLEDTSTSPHTYYRLHTTRKIEFNQTFKQSSPKKRTLHSLNDLFDGAVINTANPAKFSFEIYVVDETSTHQHKPLDLLLNYSGNSYNTFNLYFVYADYSPQVYYKIEKCVFTSGTFNIPRSGIMTVELQGDGTKLTRTTGVFPGVDSSFDSDPTYAVSNDVSVTIGSDKLDNILSASLEVTNKISWTKNSTVQNTSISTDASNSVYPESFSLEGRTLGGSISQYVNSTVDTSTSKMQTWDTDTTVRIQAGLSSSNYQLDVNMPDACSFTNRTNFSEVFSQNYDYRLTKSAGLDTYFTY